VSDPLRICGNLGSSDGRSQVQRNAIRLELLVQWPHRPTGRSPLNVRSTADFGLVPNFFSSAPDAPELVARQWDFAKAGYLDNPLPSLFKERLFVYLSRFCEVCYCIVRHCAFLLGHGHAAGDPSATQTIEQVIRLLKSSPPWQRDLDVVFSELEALSAVEDWPAPETQVEDWVIAAATLIFVEPARSERPRRALYQVLGGRFEHLLGSLRRAAARTRRASVVSRPQHSRHLGADAGHRA
jgi:hypothetical protein